MGKPALPLARGLGLILDLDGVIVDSMPVHEEAWREYLRRNGIISEEIIRRMHGRKNEEILRDFMGEETSPEEIFAHGAKKEQLYREMMDGKLETYLVPGVREFLERAEGVPIAVASNAERANVDFVLDGLGLRAHITVALDSSCVKLPKPAPEIYRRAAHDLGVPPQDCIVFEDSEVGVTAGRKAGMRVIGILTGRIPLKEVDLAVANFASPELEPWLAAQHIR
jgi:HAD superfamily hydrolase (TIGR01509 family)